MSQQRKLGRGLGALVALAPASEDGTARVDDVVRADDAPSVLSLSGRSVEDFFRVIPREEITAAQPARVAPAPAAVPEPEPAPPAPMDSELPPDDDGPPQQYTLFDPPVDDGVVAETPEPVAEPAPPSPAVQPPAEPAPAVLVDDLVFLDEQVGGFVVPDVDLD